MESLVHRLFGITRQMIPRHCHVDIICLAWSRKHGGRCLAGVRTDGGGWVRPVGEGDGGALPETLEARVLDILRVSLSKPCPKSHQPENWKLRQVWYNPWHKPCRRVVRLTREDVADRLRLCLSREPLLLGSRSDRVSEDSFDEMPAQESLALIQPEDLRWLIKTNSSGQRRTRAVFCWKGTVYNLAVSDPAWEQRLSGLEPGSHPHVAVTTADEAVTFLTISLGEPFNGYCYKLVAAVIVR